MMERFVILLTCFVASWQLVQAQSTWGLEIGSFSGVNYNYQLSKKLNVDLRAGLEFADIFDPLEAVNPIVSIEPRFNFSSESYSDKYLSGAYLGVHLFSAFPSLDPVRKRILGAYEAQVMLGFAPSFGWVFPIGERGYTRLSMGAGFTWSKLQYPRGFSYWDSSASRHKLPIIIQATYGVRF